MHILGQATIAKCLTHNLCGTLNIVEMCIVCNKWGNIFPKEIPS